MKKKKSDLIKFIAVMIFFFIGLIIMIANHVHSWWIWAIYIAIWTATEAWIAKDFHLKWWLWVMILLGLSVIDLIAIRIFA